MPFYSREAYRQLINRKAVNCHATRSQNPSQNICLSDIARIFSLRQEFLCIFYEISPSKNKGLDLLCRLTEQHKLLAEMRQGEVSKRVWVAQFLLTRTSNLPFADVYCVVQKSYLMY